MTNEEIIDTTRGTELWQYYGEEINKLLDLARQDEREKWKPYLLDSVLTDAEFKEYTGSEREKMTEEKVKGYLGGLGGKESALIVLNYLLRGGITDDDLRGLRLQWIKDEREKMQGVEVYISWDEGSFESPTVTTKQPQINKDGNGRIYHTDLGQNFTIKKEDAEKLNISPGVCKKLRIVEATP